MSGATPAPPGWYADPSRRHRLRWWDGVRWTPHVSHDGPTQARPPNGPSVPTGGLTPDDVRDHVARAGPPPGSRAPEGAIPPAGSVFDEPVLVVSQRAKVIELAAEYAVYDQHGRQVAAVRQMGQDVGSKVLRALDMDQLLTHRLEVVDARGATLLRVTRPSAAFRWRFEVERGDGTVVGEIAQENLFGKIRFGLSAGGRELGSVDAESWIERDFTITDTAGTEVARITKTWDGLAKALYTTADTYVVRIHHPLDEPLRSLVLAAALSVDTTLDEDDGAF